jgi:hypothetical protein
MTRRLLVAVTVGLLALGGTVASAQVQTGEIFGRVVDNSGAVLPGVSVTITSPALLQPQTAVTGATGTYQFPRIPIGTYAVRFELSGFKTYLREGIEIQIGFSAQVNAQLEISTVEETITVTGESPVVDTKETGTQTTFTQETLQNVPSARDPWVMLERTPGITMDRVNVGGSQSGQQSNYISRGSSGGNNKWAIDGVDITDMSATGASPIYYDFDMIQEMQVTTGGADASQQTGGVGINFVTRSGTDRFHGSGRFYVTDQKFESDNITDEIRLQGAGAGAPIQNIKDYGFEVGGPIKRGKAWFWGSYGKQDVKAGIVGFYLPTPQCQAIKSDLNDDPLSHSTSEIRDCLGTDGTLLNNYNWKVNWAPITNNKFAFQNTWAAKTKNARGASDTHPIETTYRQGAVPSTFGTYGWDVGPSPLWKASDQHIISDRWLVEAQWSHLGNNFILDFHDDSLADVQPTYEITTGLWGRSYTRSGPYIRPTQSFDLTTNYFLPGTLGGDHQIKAGYRYRTAKEHSESHYGGNTVARFRNGVASEAQMYRDSIVDYALSTQAFYLQDTYTKNRLTINIGVRLDHQNNEALSTTVPAHPFLPDWLPSVTFDGAKSPAVWNDFSPRLGMTYDFSGTGKTVAKASYSIYYGQRSPGQAVSPLNPVTTASIRFPWTDLNGDNVVQVNELDQTRILSYSGNYDPDNPTALTTSGSIDPNVKNDRTREFIVGLDHELRPGFGVSASYIWRKYDQFAWSDTIDFGSSDYVARTYTPTCTVPGARCETVTYYEPTVPIPAPYIYTNQPDRWRNYNGIELVASKRYANRWMMVASYAYNSAIDRWGSPAAYEDPTNIENEDGAQYAPETSGSGIDNIYTNAKWLVKLQGMYTLPLWDINLAGFYNARQGYPLLPSVQTPSRANRAGTATVLLDPIGDVRAPNLQTIDFRVDKAFRFGTASIVPSMDIFNLGNVNTVLARRRNQNASNANFISGIVAPRIIRFGVRVTW